MARALTLARHSLTGCLVAGLTLSGAALASPAQAADLLNTPPTAVASATPNPAHAGDTVTLLGNASTDRQTATADLAYAWTFGDGTPATGSSKGNIAVDHVFADAGVYTASLTVTDAGGKTDTTQVVVNVDDTAPVAKATATPSPAMVEQAVAFDGSGTVDAETADAGLTFAWAFGDGATSAAVSPSHAYAAAGTYAVTLTVTDPQGASSIAKLSIQATNTAPVAAGTITPSSPTAGQAVTFDGSASHDTETPASLAYSWDFGDGSPKATTSAPAHTYAASGSYPVKLAVTDPQGLTSTKSWSLSVGANQNPVATLTASQTKANVDQVVSFDGSTSADRETSTDKLTYAWDFADGTDTAAITGPRTSHAFAAAGSYAVTLTVTDADGKTGTATITITVGNTAPTAVATVTPQPAYALQEVAFDGTGSTDAETPDGLTYSWTYGDGTAATAYSSSPKATHVYTTAGSRTATLRVKDGAGAITTKTAAVSVLANAAPVAKATATPAPTHPGRTVTFDGSGSTDADGDALTYLWTFPDATTATGASTSRVFTALGTQHVTLQVTDTHGVANTTAIDVIVANAAPVAKAVATPATVHVGKKVTLSGATSTDADGDALTYLWTFADNTTATGATTTHTWDAAGTYAVQLTVTDAYGASSTATVTVAVTNAAPVAKATATPATVHPGATVTFDGSGSTDADGDALTYAWTFPDGSTATVAKPTRTFTTLGTKHVTLKVTDDHGLSDTTSVDVTVGNAAPVAHATASPTSARPGATVTFDGTTSTDADGDALTYAWTFPDDSTATGATTTHTWDATGSYTVQLTVTDAYGASDSTTVSVKVVNDAPTAAYTKSLSVPLTGKPVTFDAGPSSDTETPDALTYAWTIDGADPVAGQTVTPTFTTPGNHRVTLTVTDPQGASTTVSKLIPVARPIACESGAVTRDSYWKTVSSSASGGKHCRNTVADKGKLTIVAYGTRFGLTFGRVKGGGTARIYVDGTYVRSVSMASTSTTLTWDGRKVITGLATGKHTIVVRQAVGIGNINNLLTFGPLG